MKNDLVVAPAFLAGLATGALLLLVGLVAVAVWAKSDRPRGRGW